MRGRQALHGNLPILSADVFPLFCAGRNGASNHLPVTAMSIASIIGRVRALASRFVFSDEGKTAVGVVGAVVDYSRVSNARATIHAALDSTALIRSKGLYSEII